METDCTYLPYEDTGNFSKLVTAYLGERDELKEFYTFSPTKEGLMKAVAERERYPVNRPLLSEVMHRQYAGLELRDKVRENLSLLAKENTFTVCTAHQPNLLTGYLYFVYKILHAIKLAGELSALYSEKNFVPVYYMGSEDNDLDELGVFRYGARKYRWDGAGQTGAVGRMKPTGMEKILEELFTVMGPPGEYYDELRNILTKAYLHHDTIGEATRYLVNELFGRYGLLVLDPDDKSLKAVFKQVMKEDLLHHTPGSQVAEATQKLDEQYKAQAFPRQVNLFYLEDTVRERIEHNGGKWQVVNTSITWNEQELMAEVDAHPERFSPNVILRGLYQEMILPDVAFIGGGAEVAYWMQLKELFAHYKVFYPNIQLRQSVLWVNERERKLREQLQLTVPDIFLPEVELIKKYVTEHSDDKLSLEQEHKDLEALLLRLKEKASAIDPTLRASAEATLARMNHQVQALEKKMFRAEKRKMQVQLERVTRLKESLFPGGSLQERVENFMQYYLDHGPDFFDTLLGSMDVFSPRFVVIEK